MKVVRIWAHSITPGWVMQPAPGHYNETMCVPIRMTSTCHHLGLTCNDLHRSVRGLDFVLAEAGKRGLRVILVLADNWYKTNGIDNYVQWGGSNKHQVC